MEPSVHRPNNDTKDSFASITPTAIMCTLILSQIFFHLIKSRNTTTENPFFSISLTFFREVTLLRSLICLLHSTFYPHFRKGKFLIFYLKMFVLIFPIFNSAFLVLRNRIPTLYYKIRKNSPL